MYFISYSFHLVCIFIGCINFSSWLALASMVLFLIFTVHSYVAPTINKFSIMITIHIDIQYKIQMTQNAKI